LVIAELSALLNHKVPRQYKNQDIKRSHIRIILSIFKRKVDSKGKAKDLNKITTK